MPNQVSVIGAHFSELMNVEYHDDFSLLLTDKTIWSRLIGMKYRSLSRGKPKSKVSSARSPQLSVYYTHVHSPQ